MTPNPSPSTSRLANISDKILFPVRSNLLFFIVATLLGCATPLVHTAVNHARILWLTIYAISQSAAVAYLICLLAASTNRWRICRVLSSVVKVGYLIFTGICAAIEICAIIFSGEAVGPDSLGLVLETNPTEASGFVSQYVTAKGMLTVIAVSSSFILSCFAAYYIIKTVSGRKPRRGLGTIVAAMLLAIVGYGIVREASLFRGLFIKDYRDFLQWVSQDPGNPVLIRTNQFKFADPLSKWSYLIKDQAMQRADIDKWEQTQLKILDNPCKPSSHRDFNVVVIIGESFILSHSSLYGYYLPTNPRLETERDNGSLAIFTDMVSTANFTTTSLRNLLNLNDLSAGEQWHAAPYFPLLMKQAGWYTCHFDNQTISASSDVGLGRMIYSPLNLAHTYDIVSDSLFKYDGDFAGYAARKLRGANASGKKFVTYHLWGQHFDCRDRFPGKGRFTADDITIKRQWLDESRRAEVADYDNATHYNDSVVGEIINFWRDTPTLLFYFSDHGEDCWDLAPMGSRNQPHPEDRAWLERQYRVPFIIWMSDGFREEYPDLTGRILASADKGGMLDNFGQIVLGLCGVDTPWYRPERDLTSDSYIQLPRTTSEGYPFDAR